MDADKNGTLSFDEIKKGMALQMNSDDYKAFLKILAKLDADHSDLIDYSEFLNLAVEHNKLLSRENLEITFKTLDLENDGLLSIQDLREAFEADGNHRT